MLKRTNILICLFLITTQINSQNTFEQIIPGIKTRVKTSTLSYKIKSDKFFTGLVIRVDKNENFHGAYITNGKDTFYLSTDEDVVNDSFKNSNLIVFGEALKEIELYPAQIKNSIKVIFINDRPVNTLKNATIKVQRKKKADCVSFSLIDQDEWRDGLTEPDFNRINHEVKNVIIHHSATTLVDTNYLTVVRNIYIYHTQVNGWSDIGYNYLITPNGDIYKGRDPASYEQDNVMGAHFCKHNSGTMGICIVGHYTSDQPTEDAINSLIKLLTWKLIKDNLNPAGKNSHYLNSELGVIAGHCEGCATECPGEMLFNILDTIRSSVTSKMTSCGVVLGLNSAIKDQNIQVLSNVFDDHLWIKTSISPDQISLYSILGEKVYNATGYNQNEFIIQTGHLPEGVYLLKARFKNEIITKKVYLAR